MGSPLEPRRASGGEPILEYHDALLGWGGDCSRGFESGSGINRGLTGRADGVKRARLTHGLGLSRECPSKLGSTVVLWPEVGYRFRRHGAWCTAC